MSIEQMMQENSSFWTSLMESTSGVTRRREGRVNCTNGSYQDYKSKNEQFSVQNPILWHQSYCKVEILKTSICEIN